MDAHFDTLYGIQNVEDGKLVMDGKRLLTYSTPQDAKLALKVAYFPHKRSHKVVKLATVYTVLSDKI